MSFTDKLCYFPRYFWNSQKNFADHVNYSNERKKVLIISILGNYIYIYSSFGECCWKDYLYQIILNIIVNKSEKNI